MRGGWWCQLVTARSAAVVVGRGGYDELVVRVTLVLSPLALPMLHTHYYSFGAATTHHAPGGWSEEEEPQ